MRLIAWILVFGTVVFCNLQGALFFTDEMIRSHLKNYTQDEIALINKDLFVVRSVCFEKKKPSDCKFYLATAGGPGASKTTILETFLQDHPEFQEGIYLDPDPRTLRFMVHTYYAKSLNSYEIAQKGSYDSVIQNGYEKWRSASNYIVLTLLEEAFANGQSVVFGTTSTGGHIREYFQKLRENNYQIVLLLSSCPDTVRFNAVSHRNQNIRFYQSSPEDAVAKGILFPQRMKTYFEFADTLYFYWKDDLFSHERLGGIWQGGKLEIIDQEAMQSFIRKYEEDRNTLVDQGVYIPSFSALLGNR